MARVTSSKPASSSSTRRRKPAAARQASEYLALDLEVVSKKGLDAYKAATRGKGLNRDDVTRRGRVILIGVGGRHYAGDSIDRMINRHVMAAVRFVRGLPPEARSEWDQATQKTLDIGIQAGFEPNPLEFRLETETLAAVVEIGARVQVTLYAAPSESDADD